MPTRTVTVDGVEWQVWEVYPSSAVPGLLDARLVGGWLTLESATEKRRLVPIPAGWENWPEERLRLAVRAAQVVPKREPPDSG